MRRNPYARSLRIHRHTVIPDKREKTYREHLEETVAEGIPEHLQKLLDTLDDPAPERISAPLDRPLWRRK